MEKKSAARFFLRDPFASDHALAHVLQPAPLMSHLWLAPLDAELISVFATAFTFSAKKRGYRVSTERFLAALPETYKKQMTKLCKDAQSECKMSVGESDLPAPELPKDWQEKVCFSTCIQSTLLKCGPGPIGIADFLKLLCTTAVRLHCIADRNLPVDLYLFTADIAKGTVPCPSPANQALDRWQSHPPAATLSVDEHLASDALYTIMSKAKSVESLITFKTVAIGWRQAARHTLCDVDWLLFNDLSLHDLLKKGNPSPRLVLAMVSKRPACVHERDGEGLLPLQYAAAYRMDSALVAALRQATASHVKGSAAWANSAEARSIKSQLRPVRTRVAQGPIAA